MADLSRELRIGSITYHADFKGFDQDLIFSIKDNMECRYRFRPWTLKEYFRTIAGTITGSGGAIALDSVKLASNILEYSGMDDLSDEEKEDMVPLALWWSCGGIDPVDIPQEESGWYLFGDLKVRLRPWSYADRESAFDNYIIRSGENSGFDYAGFMQSMLRYSVQAVEPGEERIDKRIDKRIEELDSYYTRALINKIIEINFSGNEFSGMLENIKKKGSSQFIAKVLKICEVLGWTPGKVLNTPAAEIDKVLMLMEAAGSSTISENIFPGNFSQFSQKRKSRNMSSLAGHPDAVIIEIEDS